MSSPASPSKYDPEESTASQDGFEIEKQLEDQEKEMQIKKMKEESVDQKTETTAEEPEPMEVAEQANSEVTVNGADDTNELKRPLPEEEASEPKKEQSPKQIKLDEFTKLWNTANENPRDFQAWVSLLTYVDQQNELDTGRQAYDGFFTRYPYCYGYWKKYAELEKRKGDQDSVLKVFARGVDSIPLSVDLWVHYMDYVVETYKDLQHEDFVRQMYDTAIIACGCEYKSDKIWESYLAWERNAERWVRVTNVYDKLLATPNSKYTQQWQRFQDHVRAHPPTDIVSAPEMQDMQSVLKGETPVPETGAVAEAPPGEEDDPDSKTPAPVELSEEDSIGIQQLILDKREKIHQKTSDLMKARWSYEESIKRPYFHVKPLEKVQLQAWRDYLEFEMKQGEDVRTRTLFERCLIAAALYEEFWMKYIHYLETLPSADAKEISSVYVRACTIHLDDKIKPHLSWAAFEEEQGNSSKSRQILADVINRIPDALEPRVQLISVERRCGNLDEAETLFQTYIADMKTEKTINPAYINLMVRYARFLAIILRENDRAIYYLKDKIEEILAASPPSTKKNKKDSKKQHLLPEESQSAVESLIWALVDHAVVTVPPKFELAAETLKSGTDPRFTDARRLSFATRFCQLMAEFGPVGEMKLSAAVRLHRELQDKLKPKEETAEQQMRAANKTMNKPNNNANSNNQQTNNNNMQNYGQQNGNTGNYNSQGGMQNQQQQYGNTGPPPSGPPPQHPPPQHTNGPAAPYNNNMQQQGPYNQQQQGGQYPPNQQGQNYQNWGYNQQQQGYNGYNNQQQWGQNYQQQQQQQNYYGQR